MIDNQLDGEWLQARPGGYFLKTLSGLQRLSIEVLPAPLSSRAQPRDLQFRGPFVEMCFDRVQRIFLMT